MKTSRIESLVLSALLIGSMPICAAETGPGTTPRPYSERIQWWAQSRFGIFIHWGPVSLKETEISWSRANTNPKCPNNGTIPAAVYDGLYKDFNPTHFDAAQWVQLAAKGGAKYVVLTAKHCDGFLLWHSKASDYNIAATPFKRDICAELSAAARKQGMRIGWYFSPMDWRDPDFRTERNATFLAKMQSEIGELLGNYGRIDLLWFDYDGCEPLYNQEQTYQIVKKLQPAIVIDNRLDLGKGDSNTQILSTNADYYTPEQQIGAYDDQRPWESCMTLSSRDQWSWGGTNDGVKSLETCLNMLISCAGGDGNLLLNVGPMPNGVISSDQANRLNEIGSWLTKYGESIYGTRGGPFKPGDYGVSTRKGHTIYLHIRNGDDETLKLPGIEAKVLGARALTGGTASVRQSEREIEISLPKREGQLLDTIIALDLDRQAIQIPAVAVPSPVSAATKAKATASNTYQNQAEYGPDKAVDGNNDTRWATDAGVKSAWLEVDLGKPATLNRATIKQAFPELGRVRKFAIQYWEADQWKTCSRGENLGARLTAKFPPITAQRIRLNITESTDGPTISEFGVFAVTELTH